MSIEQLIKKKEEFMISSFLEEGGIFISSGCSPLFFFFLSLFLFISLETLVSILQNSPP
jgi:hypothetical protein